MFPRITLEAGDRGLVGMTIVAGTYWRDCLFSSGIFEDEIIVEADFSSVVLAQLHLDQLNMNSELAQLHANILQAGNYLLNGLAQPTIGSNSSADR